MSEYALQAQQALKPIGNAAIYFFTHPQDSLTSGAKSVTDTTTNLLKTLSEGLFNLAAAINTLKHKAIHMVTTIRATAHGSVDGMLIGMGVGFVLGGPLGVGYGAWIGTAAGAVYGFSEANDIAYFQRKHVEVL